MSKKTVILISGKAGSGKSTKAKLIKELFGSIAEITSFATAVKNPLNPACFEMFKCRSQDLDPKTKELFRPVLQAYGQVGRRISPEYWVDKTKEIINKSLADIAIIDDCRFENELNSFEDYNTIKIRLNRTSANENVNQDISETGLDHIAHENWDLVFTDKDTNRTFASFVIGTLENIGSIEGTHFKNWIDITDIVDKFEAELC